MFKRPPPLIYINRGDRLRVPAFINQFLEAGTLKNLAPLIYINGDSRFKVPAFINRFLEAGILKGSSPLIYINRVGRLKMPTSINRHRYKYKKLRFLLHLLSPSHSLPPHKKVACLPFHRVSRHAWPPSLSTERCAQDSPSRRGRPSLWWLSHPPSEIRWRM